MISTESACGFNYKFFAADGSFEYNGATIPNWFEISEDDFDLLNAIGYEISDISVF